MTRVRVSSPVIRCGLGLVEAVCSMLIVAVLLTAALTAAGASVKGRLHASLQVRARKLAEDLLAEALQQRYREPGGPVAALGPDSGEGGTGRALFDDVDDYAGWSESPPQSAAGVALPDLTGWSRTVEISWVDGDDLKTDRYAESGVKRVTVRVSLNGRPLAALSSVIADVPHYPEEQ